jgi:hypothetical protein
VALMRLQASLPTSQPEDVTMLIFGSVEIENAVQPAPPQNLTVTAPQNVNVRSEPSSSASVIGTLAAGTTVTGVERLADNSWLRVQMPYDTNMTGWVASSLLSGSIELLNVTQANTPYLQSMQSFYFKSDNDIAACQDIPASGLLIQTPEGAGKVRLWINEVKFQIGSTIYVEAEPGISMTIRTLEGEALVETMGVTQRVMAGTQAQIQIDENLKPLSPPSFPQPYEMSAVQGLPIDALTQPITIQPPLTRQEIQEIVATQNPPPDTTTSNTSVECSGDSCNQARPVDNCSGNSCNTPGHDDDCPGNRCNAPGHNKDEPPGGNTPGGNDSRGEEDDGPGRDSGFSLGRLLDRILRRLPSS